MSVVAGDMFHPPPVQTMHAMDSLMQGDGVMLKQLTNECCKFCCCQPNIHWTLHSYKAGVEYGFDQVQYEGVWVQEDATCCGRTCSYAAPGSRATTYRTLAGPADENAPISATSLLTHSKGCTNGSRQLIGFDDGGRPIFVPCCCCLPYLETSDSTGRVLGRTEYVRP
jgi:hypothetical protein